jgi:hypothetical protein
MEQNQANLLQGTVGLLILKTPGDGEFYGADFTPDRAEYARHISGQTRLAFPCPSSHGRGRMANFHLGRVRE